MKKIIFALLLAVTSLFAGTNLVHSYDEGLEIAKKDNKKVLLIYSQEGCPACEYMSDVVFENEQVANYLNTYFVVIHLDVYKNGMIKGFRAFGTPTMYFLDKNGNEISQKVVGGMAIPDFILKLQSIK